MDLYEPNYKRLDSLSEREKDSHISKDNEPILCNHCKRTLSNGIRCMGICVADNDY
tara:strand:+ start:368 stop:535 length:168 start_codon:yes stop_codon:yes gene_type:complete